MAPFRMKQMMTRMRMKNEIMEILTAFLSGAS